MATQRDYYEVLGVAKDTAPDDIKKAYKKLAIKYHPDRNPGDDAAIESFKEAAEAFDVLSDVEKRARYDRFGHQGVQAGAGGRGQGFGDINDIFDVFGDMFEGFGLGGGRRGKRGGGGGGSRATQGDSLKTRITIDLLEAAKGCSRTVDIPRREVCKTCKGSGAKAGSKAINCDYCGGHGQIVQSQGFFRVQTVCPACRGEGKVVRDKCAGCSGAGKVPETVKLDVKIPPGVDTGMTLSLRGEGEAGLNGGPRGDLYVEVNVTDHPLFERDGQNLICDVPITYTQAVLGADIDIPSLDGKRKHHIYPGTQPGEIVRLRGAGMPDPRGGTSKGDLLLRILVDVPKKVSAEQEVLLRELAELEHANVSVRRSSFFDRLKDWFVPAEDAE